MSKETKIALLSNVNMNFVIRQLKQELTVYDAEGYGNELGTLMDPNSSYHAFAPSVTFLVMDLMEVIGHNTDPLLAKESISDWFRTLESTLSSETVYYVSDTCLWGPEAAVLLGDASVENPENLWMEALKELYEKHENVRIFPYKAILTGLGEENAYSLKTWYMGKILLSGEAQKRLALKIAEAVALEERTPKKVLVLDLDNTLWGGLAGEADIEPIQLSEDHRGLAYKSLQRVILRMQQQGVLLAIVSKNNEEDAMNILMNHPHMVLRPECFAAKKINWLPKNENIEALAKELNLGLDSFVFFDDNPAERELIENMLPMVCVAPFPEKPEALAETMVQIYKEHFKKPRLTAEDKKKTDQYAANEKRAALQGSSASFEEYLQKLAMVITRVPAKGNEERLLQLLNKTNQFNLTTIRHTHEDLAALLEDPGKEVFFYKVEDRFGDNGLVAALILVKGEVPYVKEFVMSCRVMGRRIEELILDQVAEEVKALGNSFLRGVYVPTEKNKPVASLYEKLGGRLIPGEYCTEQTEGLSGEACVYEMDLSRRMPVGDFAKLLDMTK